MDVVCLDGKQERFGEEWNGMIGGWQAVGGGRCGSRVVVAVEGHVQVPDVVYWCDADHTFPLKAGPISGTQSLRVLWGSLSGWVIGFSVNGIHT